VRDSKRQQEQQQLLLLQRRSRQSGGVLSALELRLAIEGSQRQARAMAGANAIPAALPGAAARTAMWRAVLAYENEMLGEPLLGRRSSVCIIAGFSPYLLIVDVACSSSDERRAGGREGGERVSAACIQYSPAQRKKKKGGLGSPQPPEAEPRAIVRGARDMQQQQPRAAEKKGGLGSPQPPEAEPQARFHLPRNKQTLRSPPGPPAPKYIMNPHENLHSTPHVYQTTRI